MSKESMEEIAGLIDIIASVGKEKSAAVLKAARIEAEINETRRLATKLRRLTEQQWVKCGLTKRQATKIVAALELGRKAFASHAEVMTVGDPIDVASLFAEDLSWEEQEMFAIASLDVKLNVIEQKVMTIGSATETIVCIKELLQFVMKTGGTRFVVAHNHPSGDLEPSPQDLRSTEKLLEASSLMELPLIDHVILGKGEYRSIRMETDLWSSYKLWTPKVASK